MPRVRDAFYQEIAISALLVYSITNFVCACMFLIATGAQTKSTLVSEMKDIGVQANSLLLSLMGVGVMLRLVTYASDGVLKHLRPSNNQKPPDSTELHRLLKDPGSVAKSATDVCGVRRAQVLF